ncbi:MAG: M3 family oligoendopeptidase [Clostridia bacterium]|nr:M3 family oligoendopeptidase [Clostridia bacterium]
MKVSQIPYKRYTLEEAQAAFDAFCKANAAATCAQDVIAAKDALIESMIDYTTAASLANCRFTLDTRDEFYGAEVSYYDEIGPHISGMQAEYGKLLLTSPYRAELEGLLNPRIFKSLEIGMKCFDPCIVEDMQLENSITTEYSKFMSEMQFEFRGETMPLSALRGHLEDGDRETRRECAEAIGRGLQANAEQLDDYYDRLVKVRHTMATKLGYKNFVELGYYRMGRMDYDAEMVRKFRDNVKESLVPRVAAIKAQLAKELGLDGIMFYDDAIYMAGEQPKPMLDKDGIFAAAQEMYDAMNPVIGDFMRAMQEAEAFDVDARDGKWGGGYCTCFPRYKQPFILANFNGSCGDVDIMTHEFGHALAAHFACEQNNFELDVGGMETAECHSMSMEFLCWKYMDKFFGDKAPLYRKRHLLDALSFIPYGVIVDEFQHVMYDNPDLTPAQRKQVYLDLEAKYRPYMGIAGIPYIEEGTRWQYQMHIYESPFYYIDYCLAQTVAIGFLVASTEDYDAALNKYLAFVKCGGTKAFDALVKDAGLASPFEDGALEILADKAAEIAKSL